MNWFEFNGIFKLCLRRNEWDIVWFQHLIMKNATEKELTDDDELELMMKSSGSKTESRVRNTFSGGQAFDCRSERLVVRWVGFVFWIWDVCFSPHVCSYFLFLHAELVEWSVSTDLFQSLRVPLPQRACLWRSSSSSSVWELLFCCRDELLSVRPGSGTEASAEPLCCSGTLRWI